MRTKSVNPKKHKEFRRKRNPIKALVRLRPTTSNKYSPNKEVKDVRGVDGTGSTASTSELAKL